MPPCALCVQGPLQLWQTHRYTVCPPVTPHWEPTSRTGKFCSELSSHENNLSFWTHLKIKGSTWSPPSLKQQRWKVTAPPAALCHLTPTAAAPLVAQLQAGFVSPQPLITYLQLNPLFYLPSLQRLYVMSKFVVKRHNIQLLDKVQFFCNLLSSRKYDKTSLGHISDMETSLNNSNYWTNYTLE